MRGMARYFETTENGPDEKSGVPTMQDPGEFHETLSRAADGDDKAAEEVYPVIYDELRRIAGARMKHERQGHTLQPTALVNEAFMRVVGQEDADISSRTHFVAVASMAMQPDTHRSCPRPRHAQARRRSRAARASRGHGRSGRGRARGSFDAGRSGGEAERGR